MCMLDTVRAKGEEIRSIAKKHQAEKVWLFGSCARKEERPDSDVDFLVKFSPDCEGMYLRMMRLGEAYEALLGRKVDVVRNTAVLNPSNSRFASVVCKEAIRI